MLIAEGVEPATEGRRAGSFEVPGMDDWWLEREDGGRIEEGG